MEVKFDSAEWSKTTADCVAKLRAIGSGFPAIAKPIVRAVIDKLHDESTKRMPIDEGFLVASEQTSVNETLGGKVEGHVFIPANSPASDYALPMHEHHYNLGIGSLAKQAGQKELVGRKYMERAFVENKAKFETYIQLKIKEYLSSAK